MLVARHGARYGGQICGDVCEPWELDYVKKGSEHPAFSGRAFEQGDGTAGVEFVYEGQEKDLYRDPG